MRAEVLLWIAAAMAMIEAVAHTLLFVRYVPGHGPIETAVVDSMKATAFRFGSVPHSYWELYFGYGLFVTVGVLMEAGTLILLASWAKDGLRIRPMIALLCLGEIAYGALILKYFSLPIPLASHAAIAVCLLMAYFAAA